MVAEVAIRNAVQAGTAVITTKMMLWRPGVDSAGLTEFLTTYEGAEQTDQGKSVACYRVWLPTQPGLIELLPTLKGKTHGCWCAPQPCQYNDLRDAVLKL